MAAARGLEKSVTRLLTNFPIGLVHYARPAARARDLAPLRTRKYGPNVRAREFRAIIIRERLATGTPNSYPDTCRVTIGALGPS